MATTKSPKTPGARATAPKPGAVKRPAAKRPTTDKAKPLPVPDVPDENDIAENTELLERDARSRLGVDMEDVVPPQPRIPQPTGYKPVIAALVAGMVIGALVGGATAYNRARDTGYREGQMTAYLQTGIDGMAGYLMCTGAGTEACANQLAVAEWAREYSKGKVEALASD